MNIQQQLMPSMNYPLQMGQQFPGQWQQQGAAQFQLAMNQMAPQTQSRSVNQPTIYVGELEEQINEEMLYQFFIKYGQIYSVRVMRNPQNQKKSRGFAFVSFYSQNDAKNAIKHAYGEVILQNPIRVIMKRNMQEIRTAKTDCNAVIKNLDKSVTMKILQQFCLEFGQDIISCKIAQNEQGESKEFGYVQFETKESVDKLISEGNKRLLQGKQIEIEKFDRSVEKKNLYIKNLPSTSVEQNERALKERVQAFGPVKSILVKELQDQGDKEKKFFAFVCFEREEDAQKFYDNQQKADDPTNPFPSLYLNWYEKKYDRLKKLKQEKSKIKNETNVYTKNLKKTVTTEELKSAFATAFGKIGNCKVVFPKTVKPLAEGQAAPVETCFGFMNFESKEDAKKAISDAKQSPEICALYINESPANIYINFHQPKDQYQIFKQSQQRTRRQQYNQMGSLGAQQFKGAGFQYPMNPFMIMQQFMMMMMGGGAYQMNPTALGNQARFNNPMGGRNNYNRMPQQPNQRGNKMFANNPQGQNRPRNIMNTSPVKTQPKPTHNFQTVEQLKTNLTEFTQLEIEKQRDILGEMLFPKIKEIATDPNQAPKITGMLIDFDVFEVADIVDFLLETETLKERVQEAEELIRAN